MSVLIRTDSSGRVVGRHNRPEMLDDPESQGVVLPLLVQPDYQSGRDYRLTLTGNLPLWQSRTSAELDDDGSVITEPGPWEDESAVFEEQKRQMVGPDVEFEYQNSLERGFTFDGGVFSATGPKRHRVVELVTQQNAGRGMPRGKASKTFHDKGGVAHDFSPQQIVDLAAAGSDHVESADDRYEELMGQITSATSQADLDAIDVTSGWPN